MSSKWLLSLLRSVFSCCPSFYVLPALLIATMAFGGSPADRAWEWNADNTDLTTPTYSIIDDLAGDDGGTDRQHGAASYFFRYCRRGVCQSADEMSSLEDNADLAFSELTPDYDTDPGASLFVMRCPNDEEEDDLPWQSFVSGALFCGGGANHLPWSSVDTDWDTGEVVLEDVDGNYDYILFRYLHFPSSLHDSLNETTVSTSNRKLVVLIHGWNSGQNADPFDASDEWSDLIDELISGDATSKLLENQWAVVLYNWASDGDTGSLFGNYPEATTARRGAERAVWEHDAQFNAAEAAETAHMHGQHLGELIAHSCPSVESVHFIAHSAGSWCARTAARHLLRHTAARVQVTLLDPYMPAEASETEDDSILGKAIMGELDDIAVSGVVYRLENYYARDITGDCTEQTFDWSDSRHRNLRIDDIFHYADHSGPVEWYGDTIDGSPDTASESGWLLSMLWNEPDVVAGPSPLDGATGCSTTTLLQWSDDEKATEYRVHIATDAASLESTSPTAVLTPDVVSWDPGVLAPDSWYYWRVDATNDAGTVVGNAWSFRTGPGNGDPTPTPTPVNEARFADSQECSVSSDGAFWLLRFNYTTMESSWLEGNGSSNLVWPKPDASQWIGCFLYDTTLGAYEEAMYVLLNDL